jgi:hypothetical protein
MNRLDLLSNIDNPKQLEKLYRENKAGFKAEFNLLYPELTGNKLADYWNERLNYESSEISWGSQKEIIFVIIAALIAGLIAKLPGFLKLNPEVFYQRNIGFIVFPVLTAYFIWKRNLPAKTIVIAAVVFLISAIFINLFPENDKSDTLILSCIHLVLLLWAVLGFSYAGENVRDHQKRIGYLRYNGDLVIMSGLIVIAGGLLTAITIGLFHVIGINIEKFYFDYVVVFGLAAVPIVATHIVQTNPELVNKISPVIAKLFSPLVLIMLVVYLAASLFSGKDPYQDRDFLMIFNALLIGVMAIIFFSIGTFKKNESRTSNFILLALSIVTIVVNGIALTAILFRILEWGITPNRLAILGANILMLTHLLMVTFSLYKNVFRKTGSREVENSISKFIPVYIVWAVVVTFIFPLLFQFK